MADAPVPSLARARELKINELSTHFANDDLSLEDLERRIEQVYRAVSVAELETITADLKSAATVPADFVRAKVVRGKGGLPATYEVAETRVLSLMSSIKRVGRWAVPRQLKVVAIMSETELDLTHAVLATGDSELEIRGMMASLKIIVPPGMRVIDNLHTVMATVRSRADSLPPDDVPSTASAPVIRLTGFVCMADVQVVVRRREDPAPDDDE
jgi:hypothetical protein